MLEREVDPPRSSPARSVTRNARSTSVTPRMKDLGHDQAPVADDAAEKAYAASSQVLRAALRPARRQVLAGRQAIDPVDAAIVEVSTDEGVVAAYCSGLPPAVPCSGASAR